MPVKERDNGYRALRKRLEAAKGSVTVGIHEAEGSETAEGSEELAVLDVAAFAEFGTENAPRRSFIADWADETEEANNEALRRGAQAVVNGTLPSMHNALDRVGQKFVGDVQARIKAGIEPPNAESTVEKKGSSTPLIDTGQLWTSVRHEVHDE
jgi:hypothetical protein